MLSRSRVLRGVALAVALVALVACASREPTQTPPRPEAGPRPGTIAPDGSVYVGHERELRGAWIATVSNSTWPSRPGLGEVEAKAELVAIFDALVSARMNAVFLQVRSESDALYPSTLEPWSRFLTGRQGEDPGWDPLAFAVDEAHRRGLELHAWLNPYRALVDASADVAPTHPTRTLASGARRFGNLVWMDPGVPEVRAHILDVIGDLLARYEIDGVHFDDYFYPYPVAGAVFDDASSYAVYQRTGRLGREDWRRSNVDALVRETHELVLRGRGPAAIPVRFGISPFGIYRPGTPSGIRGLDAYATLYADPVRWVDEGWVDYLVPQLYWPTTQSAQAFGKLALWWAGLARNGRAVFVGHDATKAGQGAFTLDEYEAQLGIVRGARGRGLSGSVFFSAKPLTEDRIGLRSTLAARWFTTAAIPPPFPSVVGAPADAPPIVTQGSSPGEMLVMVDPVVTRFIAVYARADAGVTLTRLELPTSSLTRVILASGAWALALVDRRGAESRGAPVTVD